MSPSGSIPYNDAFGEYLDTLIRVEKRNPEDLKDHEQIKNLKRQKKFYEQEVEVLKQAVSNKNYKKTTSTITVEDIGELKDELIGLKHYGPSLKSMLGTIQNLERKQFREMIAATTKNLQ